MLYRTVAAALFSIAALAPLGAQAQLSAALSPSASPFSQTAPGSEDLSERALFLCESLMVPWMYSVPTVGIDAGALPGIPGNRSGGYIRIPDSARPSCDASVRDGAVLSDRKVFVIGGVDSRIFAAAGATGGAGTARTIELGDLRLPFLRVGIAPSSANVDVESLVKRRPQLGIFNALFVPAGATRLGSSATSVAALTVPAAPAMPAAAPLPAPVLVAFAAPIEERSVASRPIPPAAVEERIVASAPSAPVEERVIVAMALVPAAVEERFVAPAPQAPIEERVIVARALVPAKVEERIVATPAPEPVRFEPVQVASAAPVAVILVAAAEVPAAPPAPRTSASTFKPITVSAPPPRLMQMFDRRGGSFFM